MIAKVKSLCTKHREVLMYLIFGFLTTVVGWSVYYALLFGGRAIFDIPADETTSVRYLALYTAAQILQWVCAGLFAFSPTARGCLPLPTNLFLCGSSL